MSTTKKSSTKKTRTQQRTTNNISTSKRIFATKSTSFIFNPNYFYSKSGINPSNQR